MHDHTPLLTDVERDLLGGDATFPTSFQVAVTIRKALDDPDTSAQRLALLLNAEPLVTSKLLRLANCYTFNPRGQTVYSVDQAIQRVGFNAVRSVAMAVAMVQLKAPPGTANFLPIAEATWSRSVQRAALCKVLAQPMAWDSPEEAMLCGLVAELGVFYLLSRAAPHKLYSQEPIALQDLLDQHQASVSARLLFNLGLPHEVVAAVSPQAGSAAPDRLQAILREADRLSHLPFPPPADEPRAELLLTSQDILHDIRSALGS